LRFICCLHCTDIGPTNSDSGRSEISRVSSQRRVRFVFPPR
jgi:hypothetical protein